MDRKELLPASPVCGVQNPLISIRADFPSNFPNLAFAQEGQFGTRGILLPINRAQPLVTNPLEPFSSSLGGQT